jgi:hypothetical protein
MEPRNSTVSRRPARSSETPKSRARMLIAGPKEVE